jgi:hypothetical protein
MCWIGIKLFLCSFWNPILPQPLFTLGTKLTLEKKKGAEKIICSVYKITDIIPKYLKAAEYMKETTNDLLKRTSPNKVNLPNKDLVLVKVLY